MIGDNADMIMVAHLNIPALDTTPKCPSSLSYPIITKLLKQEYGFSGIIITDGMEMKGVRQQDRFDGDAEIRALLAGVDILLLPGKTETIVHAIKQAVDSGKIPVKLIDDRCLRILQYKEKKGILDYTPVDIAKIPDLINTPSQKQISEEIERKAITMLTNHQNFLPMAIVPNDTIQADSIVFLCIGRDFSQLDHRNPPITVQRNLNLESCLNIYEEMAIKKAAANKPRQKIIIYHTPRSSIDILFYARFFCSS